MRLELSYLTALSYLTFSFTIALGYDKGVVTHVRSFKEYVDDLEHFVKKEAAPRARAEAVASADSFAKVDKFIYVANSMAGMD